MQTNKDHQETEENSPQRLSALLQTTRLAQGKSLAQIAEATGISTQNVQAIEEENNEKLPARVFVRGFIRLYAQQLDLDPHIAVDKFAEEWTEKPSHLFNNRASLQDKGNPFSILRIISIVLTIVLLSGVSYLVINNYRGSQKASTLPQEPIMNPPEMIPEPTITSSSAQTNEKLAQGDLHLPKAKDATKGEQANLPAE